MNTIPSDAIFSVSEFLDFTNELLKPIRITIQGEVTSVTPRGKTIFFTLSDPDQPAKLECVIWQYRYQQLGFNLIQGAEVQLVGKPNIYKPAGKFSFVVDHINPVGEGALKKALELLKKKLNQAGFFDPAEKQTLPKYPQKIGLVTSKNGDALTDFKTHLGEYGYQLFHKDARVEGLQAIDSIVTAIEWFNQQPRPVELLVLTRGGGSLESLQAFNSEPVATAIFASKIPVISAVGHENDVTIADLVADVRASTPTDAAKIVSHHWSQVEQHLDNFQNAMLKSLRYLINQYHHYYQQSWQRMIDRVEQTIDDQKETVSQLLDRAVTQYQHRLSITKEKLTSLQKQLALSDPQLKLKQGYSIIVDTKGSVIKSVRQVSLGQELALKLADGKIHSKVTKK